MEQKPTQDEADRRAREVAHRLLTTPPQPKANIKQKPKPARSGVSSAGTPPPTGGAS